MQRDETVTVRPIEDGNTPGKFHIWMQLEGDRGPRNVGAHYLDLNLFVAPRMEHVHLLRRLNGYGISLAVLTYLREALVDEIHVYVFDRNHVLEKVHLADLDTWFAVSDYVRHPPFEPQLVLGLDKFKRTLTDIEEPPMEGVTL